MRPGIDLDIKSTGKQYMPGFSNVTSALMCSITLISDGIIALELG